MAFEAVCNKCDYTKTLTRILRSYKLSGGERVTIEQVFAWCHSCSDVQWAERIPSVADIQQEIKESIKWRKEIAQSGEDHPFDIEKYIDDLHDKLLWRKNRNSPAKCLECGHTKITTADFYEEPEHESEYYTLEHIGCGGIITIRNISLSLNRLWLFYAPEGNRLSAYDASPSKGLVPVDNE